MMTLSPPQAMSYRGMGMEKFSIVTRSDLVYCFIHDRVIIHSLLISNTKDSLVEKILSMHTSYSSCKWNYFNLCNNMVTLAYINIQNIMVEPSTLTSFRCYYTRRGGLQAYTYYYMNRRSIRDAIKVILKV